MATVQTLVFPIKGRVVYLKVNRPSLTRRLLKWSKNV